MPKRSSWLQVLWSSPEEEGPFLAGQRSNSLAITEGILRGQRIEPKVYRFTTSYANTRTEKLHRFKDILPARHMLYIHALM
jgi:hypothetical protein